MNDLTDTTERPLTLRQAEPPRVNVHVDLYAISRDVQAIKTEIALRPTRWEVLKLAVGRRRGRAAADTVNLERGVLASQPVSKPRAVG